MRSELKIVVKKFFFDRSAAKGVEKSNLDWHKNLYWVISPSCVIMAFGVIK